MPLVKIFLFVSSLILLPLAGVIICDQPVDRYLEFPPLTRYVPHAPFAWPVFFCGSFFALLVFLFVVSFFVQKIIQPVKERRFAFPWWGKSGLCLLLIFWFFAWNRFAWFAPFQAWTFTPLWLGYILMVNGMSYFRKGSCLLLTDCRRFALLFPVSALFWWYFEYLNRFVQNWYYVGVDDFSGLSYVLHATLCFATVLPAVMSTCELLSTFSRLNQSLALGPVLNFQLSSKAGRLLLVSIGCILAGLSHVPDLLFPFVWIAPLFLFLGLQGITGEQTFLASLSLGDWRPVLLPALSALLCGFFWELWNWNSLAHWEYSIAYVDRYHLFAMPILGYLGYLPFGLECQIIAVGFMGFTPCNE